MKGAVPVLTHCPTCRRRLADDDLDCARCRSDLRLIRRVFASALRAQTDARTALVRGDTGVAVEKAYEAVAAVDEPCTRATLLAALAARRKCARWIQRSRWDPRRSGGERGTGARDSSR